MKPSNPAGPSNPPVGQIAMLPLALAIATGVPEWGRAGTAPGEEATRDERGLVQRARRGDEEAFQTLVDRHRDRAFGLALRITRSRQDAEDAAQEAFVRAWLALPCFRGESSFGTWLHSIVARRALDRATARRIQQGREAVVEAAEALPAAAGEGRDVLLARRLDRLIEQLSAPQRAVVALFDREDRPVEEIAAALEMPASTVKTHLSRARAALREAWLREEATP